MIIGRHGVARGETPVPAGCLGRLGEEVGLGVDQAGRFPFRQTVFNLVQHLAEHVFRARTVRYFEQVDVRAPLVQEALSHLRVVAVVYLSYWGIGSQLDDDLAWHEAPHGGESLSTICGP